jgi:hypothetical protein
MSFFRRGASMPLSTMILLISFSVITGCNFFNAKAQGLKGAKDSAYQFLIRLPMSSSARRLYNGSNGHYNDLPGEKLFMPQVSQRDEQKQYYG